VYGSRGGTPGAARARIAAVLQEMADFTVVTADNPRGEPLPRIFSDLRAAIRFPEKFAWVDDRRRAIGLALGQARPGDVVLVAGKGHECCQEIADTAFPFDDRQVARACLRAETAGPFTP
jgi:UDP-N-acetylmuramoyl-L-alanyl-D-glutamate--2,6-diaminopimelate ligase